jgi:Zn-dependent peptidase ImmA (M78 family)/transcriptional regulator with XRE-family HTH domain
VGRSTPALANPALLKWARQIIHLPKDRLAEKMEVSVAEVEAWESGATRLTFAQLRRVAEVLRRDLSVFFLPEPPEEVSVPPDFRRFPDGEARPSTELLLEVREALLRRDAMLEVYRGLGEALPTFSLKVEPGLEPDTLADHLRLALGLTLPAQRAAASARKSLTFWRQAIEQAGVLVFQSPDLSMQEARAFALPAEVLPIVVLNSHDAEAGRIFSLCHELCHLVMDRGNLHRGPTGEHDPIEVLCNAVAGRMLLPASALDAELQSAQEPANEVKRLARAYGLSERVVLRRLLDTRRLDRAEFQRLDTIQAHFVPPPTRKGQPSPYRVRTSQLGKPYVRTILVGYRQGLLSPTATSRLVRLKVNRLQKLIEEAS